MIDVQSNIKCPSYLKSCLSFPLKLASLQKHLDEHEMCTMKICVFYTHTHSMPSFYWLARGITSKDRLLRDERWSRWILQIRFSWCAANAATPEWMCKAITHVRLQDNFLYFIITNVVILFCLTNYFWLRKTKANNVYLNIQDPKTLLINITKCRNNLFTTM